MADRLFISHASEDEAVVNRIVAYLEAHGVVCWIAGRDIPPKAIYAEAITSGIQNSSACGVIVSRAANASAAIKRELELASHYGKPFVPIRVDATEPGPGLDYYLRNTQWINYGRDGNKALDRITAHMGGGAPAPQPAPPPPSYTPPPRYEPPPPEPVKRNFTPFIAVGAALVVAVVAWIGISAMQNRATTTVGTEVAESFNTATSVATPGETEAQRDERERLQRERDDAIAAARTAEQRLADERAQRQTTERSSQIVGVWEGTYSRSPYHITFSADGTWHISHPSVSMCRGGTWSQQGRTRLIAQYTGDCGGRIDFDVDGDHMTQGGAAGWDLRRRQ